MKTKANWIPYPTIIYDFSDNYFERRKHGIKALKLQIEKLSEKYKSDKK